MSRALNVRKLLGLVLLIAIMLQWNYEPAYASKKATVGGDFTLTDHHGKKFELKQLRGKLVLIFFGYTFCPDICPTELTSLAKVLKSLGDDADKVSALFLSLVSCFCSLVARSMVQRLSEPLLSEINKILFPSGL